MNIKDMPKGSYAKIIRTDLPCVSSLHHLYREKDYPGWESVDLTLVGGGHLRNFFKPGGDPFPNKYKSWDEAYTYLEIELIDESEVDWTRCSYKPGMLIKT
jgi:hypothetical protein